MTRIEYGNGLTAEWTIGDCLQGMSEMADNTVDLVICDPPYYKIKDVEWDNQWDTMDEYLEWLLSVCLEIKRVMKDNGSFYIFGDEKIIAYVQVMLDKHFTLINNMVWYKRNNISIKWAHNHRSFAPTSERFLFYGLQDRTGLETVMLDTNNFQTLRKYFYDLLCFMGERSAKGVNDKLGHRRAEHSFYVLPKKVVIEKIGQKADHCFRYGSTQWDLPTEETYGEIIRIYGIDNWVGFREYEDLRREYEELRRTYNHQKGVYDVIDIPIINEKENTAHPTTKPLELIEIFIRASSNPGDMVFDPMVGSGTTLMACRNTGRNCRAFEVNPDYEPIISKRIRAKDRSIESFF